jgi:hypothetical protein
MLGCVPGIMGGGPDRLPDPPPVDPRDPPPEEPPFCARMGKADKAIVRAQNATGFKRAIPSG